jgi:nicotinamide mononucleotide transporter
MTQWLEICANGVNTASIVLAARNSVHTWWTGIVGCLLFAVVFFDNQLYADALLQVFFVGTSIHGWRLWAGGTKHTALAVTRAPPTALAVSLGVAILVAAIYGYCLKRFTDAYAPFVDSAVLALSVLAQLLLMKRRYETWWIWIVVNTLCVLLFGFRSLWLTAVLYAAYWLNAVVASISWRRLLARS